MKYFRSHENADLTFKDHSIKRKSKPVLCIQLPSGVPIVRGTTDLELGPPHVPASYWPYSFKVSPKFARSMDDTDYAKLMLILGAGGGLP